MAALIRKDDDSYAYTYSVYSYFARRGIGVAHVDVRGTGGSDGLLPDREYSDTEFDDLEQIVDGLSKLPWSNAIGGLLDGYRDFVPQLLDHAKVPVHAEIGPWNHAWPHDGEPAPNYEWRKMAVRWWQHWLQGQHPQAFNQTCLTVFQRAAVPPDTDPATTPGEFRRETWPVPGLTKTRYFLQEDHGLSPTVSATGQSHSLAYVPSGGIDVGNWWGEVTGDMRNADKTSLVYDSEPLKESQQLLGSTQVTLTASANAPLAHWIVRVEDVFPDGRVTLVTGGLINGAQSTSRSAPQRLIAGEMVTLEFPLRFTSYTFEPGHKIRVAVSNAQFPMIWPTPYRMTTSLLAGQGLSYVELPVVPPAATVILPVVEQPDEVPADSRSIDSKPMTSFVVVRDDPHGVTEIQTEESASFTVRGRHVSREVKLSYWVDNSSPASAGFRGDGSEEIVLADRRLQVMTHIDVTSSKDTFHAVVRRLISENGTLLDERSWDEVIPRDFQ